MFLKEHSSYNAKNRLKCGNSGSREMSEDTIAVTRREKVVVWTRVGTIGVEKNESLLTATKCRVPRDEKGPTPCLCKASSKKLVKETRSLKPCPGCEDRGLQGHRGPSCEGSTPFQEGREIVERAWSLLSLHLLQMQMTFLQLASGPCWWIVPMRPVGSCRMKVISVCQGLRHFLSQPESCH